MKVQLRRIAHVRSGDKGDTSTVSVFAYSDEVYPILKDQVTAAAVKAFYGSAVTGEVTRYEVDGLCGLNFAIRGSLGGGVSRSLAIDNYGKAFSAALLGLIIEIPDTMANHVLGQ